MALLGRVTGLESLFAMRMLSFFSGVGSVVIFYRMASDAGASLPRTIQFFLMPLFFVYLFLVYTDGLSLFLVLLMLYLARGNKMAWAGLAGILAMLVRQNNVIWVGMVIWMALADQWPATGQWHKLFRKTWSLVLALLLFVAFFIVNGGAAAGDVAHHPPFVLSVGNVFVSLLYFFILFLPLHLSNFRRIEMLCRKWYSWAALATLFAVYMWLFQNDHPYNRLVPHYFIRSALLEFVTSSRVMQALFFIPMAYAALSAAATPFQDRSQYVMYAFGVLFLIPSWLIEGRYYLIPFTLFLLYREPGRKQTEWAGVVYYMLILAVVLPLMARSMIFL